MTAVVAIVGISGVGKSTFIRRLEKFLAFQHLSAGQIIKFQRERESQTSSVHDELRKLDVDENQRLLVEGFSTLFDGSQKLTVFDGHTVIDTSNELKAIGAEVFEALGVQAMVFLQEQPEVVLSRRASDTKRSRPLMSLEEIARHQAFALVTTAEISLGLKIPVFVLDTSQTEQASKFIRLLMDVPSEDT